MKQVSTIFLFLVLIVVSACASNVSTTSAPSTTTADGLQIQDTLIGTGTEAKPGMNLSMQYNGMLTDGTVFDSSYKRGQPFAFTLGAGRVIKGWDEGVVGMKVGGKRRLTIPPQLGYGAQGYPPVIPANATLIFDIELVAAN